VDIRAKERLTGAVILVALVVLVVPELLSGRARRAAQPAATAGEPPLRSLTVDLSDESRGAVVPRPAAAAEAEADSLAAPSRAVAPPSPQEPSAAGSSPDQPSPLLPQRKGGSGDQPPRGSPSGWWVQVGSFESREHADRYARRLKADGFAASVSEGARHGHKWYRVRVGPERDRGAARALAARLHAAGQSGSVVPP
jgi:DedD protein